MAVTIGQVLRCVVDISLPDQVGAKNIFDYVRADSVGSDPTDQAVLDALEVDLVDIYTEVGVMMVDLATAVSATVYQLSWDAGKWMATTIVGTVPIGVTGEGSSEMLPHGVSGLILLGTAAARHGGRKFFPGFTEAVCEDGFWTGGTVTQLVAAAAQYVATVSIPGGYVLAPILVGNDGVVRGYDAVGASGTPAYQRRRKPGVGS